MLMHPVAVPGSGTRSWTVLGDDDVPVVPVDRFLAYLTDIGRSPNTVKAYAHDLKDYWEFISFRGLDWREARLEDVGEFVAWLQLPSAGRSGEVAVLPTAAAEVSAATVNRKLAAVSAFYAHQACNGAGVGDLLAAWRTGSRGGWKLFLHHVSKGKPYRGRAISLKAPKKLPRILTVAEMQAILDASTRLRDRFFFAVVPVMVRGMAAPRRGACPGRGSRPAAPPPGWRPPHSRRPAGAAAVRPRPAGRWPIAGSGEARC
jgi:integrase/recombinase XerD